MGKILVTNNARWFDSLHAIFEQSGFRASEKMAFQNALLASYKKLNFENENFVRGSDGFIFCAGTVLYKGKTGAGALRELFLDLGSSPLKQVRGQLHGCFAIAACRGHRLQIFVDEMAEYNLYYAMEEGRYLITNMYYHVQSCVKSEVNGDGLLAFAARGGLVDRQTPYKNIYKLKADEVFAIDAFKDEFRIEKAEVNEHHFQFGSPEEAVLEIKKAVDEIAAERAKAFPNVLQFLTGGIDSRLELAIHKNAGANVASAYWSGKDIITNGTQKDAEISSQIADFFGIAHTQYDVTEEFEDALRNIDRKKCLKYGEYASKYACNSRWFRMLKENCQYEFLGSGFFVEGIKELGDLDRQYRQPYCVEDFAKEVYSRLGVEKYVLKSGSFYAFLKQIFTEKQVCKNLRDLSKEECFQLFTLERINADGVLDNLWNLHGYGFSIFAQKKVYDACAATPYHWHKDERLPLMLTRQYDAELLDIPYCSHHHLMKIHKETLKPSRGFKMKGKVRERIIKSPLYRLLYLNKVQRLVKPKTKSNQRIMETCIRELARSATIRSATLKLKPYKSTNGIEVASFATFVALVKALDTLNED